MLYKLKQMCYDIFNKERLLLEVKIMDEQREDIQQETPEESGYTPRPMWQVWLARIGLVLFILLGIMYYINIARGGI